MKQLLAALMLVLLGAVVLLLLVAADAPTSSPTAATVAGALVVGWGLLAPLTVYKWIPADGPQMKLITIGAAVLIAAIALYLTGGLKLDGTSSATLLVAFLTVYGETQFVWNLLKDHPRTTALVN